MKKILIIYLILLTFLTFPSVVLAARCVINTEFVINKQTRQCAYFEDTTPGCNKSILPSGWEIVKLDNKPYNYNESLKLYQQKCESYGYTYLNKNIGIPPFLERYVWWIWLSIFILSIILVLYSLLKYITLNIKLKSKNLTSETIETLKKRVKKFRNILICSIIVIVLLLVIWAYKIFVVY